MQYKILTMLTYQLSLQSVTVHTFDMLKNKCRVIKNMLSYLFHVQRLIVLATMVLHNLLLEYMIRLMRSLTFIFIIQFKWQILNRMRALSTMTFQRMFSHIFLYCVVIYFSRLWVFWFDNFYGILKVLTFEFFWFIFYNIWICLLDINSYSHGLFSWGYLISLLYLFIV